MAGGNKAILVLLLLCKNRCMSPPAALPLFSAFGVELEYMIVDTRTLGVRPIADEILRSPEGEITGEVDRGLVTWSNELVAHVVELKVSEPAGSLDELPLVFQREVQEINARLSRISARLMPGGMHPWMDPLNDTKLWPHEYNEVYEAFDRIFSCQGHGWANLQSVHLNLPFPDDEAFSRLHAAIRLVLPILPALTASSPVMEGRVSGLLDNRLEVYRNNSRKIPSIAGRVIPEQVYSRADYEEQILRRLYADVAPHDPTGVLQHEWLNARGAIARFQRNAIEIRVMDVQECPQADVALCAAVVALLRALVDERFSTLAVQQAFAVEPLEKILLGTIRDADQAVVSDLSYLGALGYAGGQCTAGELWRQLIGMLTSENLLDRRWKGVLEIVTNEGPLARRIVSWLDAARDRHAGPQVLSELYRKLCDCLENGELFRQ
jgi:glutamate---cysteine ligase / carboxylate-amine ligase